MMKSKLYSVVCAVGALCAAVEGFAAEVTKSRPNVVVIMADDMGYSDASCMGGEIPTPNIDRLAKGGVTFTQFYNTSRCCPTRAALMTGMYPHRAGVGHMTWQHFPELPGYQSDLSHDTPTIAEVLKPAGYANYMAGKWHLTINDTGDKPKDNWPRQRGFDRYYGTIKGSGSYYDPLMLVRENTPVSPETDQEYKPAKPYYYTDAIADESVRYMKEHWQAKRDQPFFLYVAFTSPHWPLQAPEEAIAKFKGKYDQGYEPVRKARLERMKKLGLVDERWEMSPQAESWDDVKNKEWEARCMEVYAAQIDVMDQGIGRIIGTLEAAGQLENTLILFLQDNGACDEAVGRKGSARKGTRGGPKAMPGPADTFIAYGRNWANACNTPFREYKHYVHEGGISTPLIAHWPAGIKRRGEWERVPSHLIDVMPTVVSVTGAEFPKEFNGKKAAGPQGTDLSPAFAGDQVKRGEPIYFEHEGNRAIRDGKWKLVAKGTNGPWELYDIEADRTEMHDLAGNEPGRVKEMAAAWETWAKENHVYPLVPWAKEKKAGAAE